jgi:hypothetical protein
MTVSVIRATNAASNEEIEIIIDEKVFIARGGWATVYRAVLLPSREIIAIKQVTETRKYKVHHHILGTGRLRGNSTTSWK